MLSLAIPISRRFSFSWRIIYLWRWWPRIPKSIVREVNLFCGNGSKSKSFASTCWLRHWESFLCKLLSFLAFQVLPQLHTFHILTLQKAIDNTYLEQSRECAARTKSNDICLRCSFVTHVHGIRHDRNCSTLWTLFNYAHVEPMWMFLVLLTSCMDDLCYYKLMHCVVESQTNWKKVWATTFLCDIEI